MVVGGRVLRRVHSGGEQLAAASVDHIQLVFPSLSRPLTARISGVRLHVQQVKLPKVRRRRQMRGRARGREGGVGGGMLRCEAACW